MLKLTLFTLLLLSYSFSTFAKLKPFTSDGCSKWINGTVVNPTLWKSCCFQHDISYWMGGTSEEKESADKNLRQCVSKKFSDEMGFVMWVGVKIGGKPSYHTPYRWGYGWDKNRGYQSLSETEKKMVSQELDRSCFIGEEKVFIRESLHEKGLMKYSQQNDLSLL